MKHIRQHVDHREVVWVSVQVCVKIKLSMDILLTNTEVTTCNNMNCNIDMLKWRAVKVVYPPLLSLTPFPLFLSIPSPLPFLSVCYLICMLIWCQSFFLQT
jgi:hypothetical protein